MEMINFVGSDQILIYFLKEYILITNSYPIRLKKVPDFVLICSLNILKNINREERIHYYYYYTDYLEVNQQKKFMCNLITEVPITVRYIVSSIDSLAEQMFNKKGNETRRNGHRSGREQLPHFVLIFTVNRRESCEVLNLLDRLNQLADWIN